VGMVGSAVLFALGWLCIATVPVPPPTATVTPLGTLTALMFGRSLTGVGIGFTCCVVNIYVSELSPANLRGALGTLFQVHVVAGLLFAYLCGVFLPWRPMAWLVVILSGFVTLLLLAVPESPQWLLQRGKRAEAAAALRRLRAADTPVDAIVDGWDIETSKAADSTGALWVELCRPSVLRPLGVGVGLALLQQLSGINTVIFYCGEIFSGVLSKPHADIAAVGVQVVHLGVTIVVVPVIDRLGRRPLLLCAGAGMAVCAGLVGLYFLLDGTNHALPKGVAVGIVYAYMGCFAIGMGAIPWLILGEIFPPQAKGVCSSLATAVNWLTSFAVTKTAVDLKASLGYTGLFWLYAGCLLIGEAFIYFMVPETKGRTLAEIQAAFEGREDLQYVPIPATGSGLSTDA